MTGSAWLPKPSPPFFPSSIQTKHFYLTSRSFCVRDFSPRAEQCSQPLTQVSLRGALPPEAAFLFYVPIFSPPRHDVAIAVIIGLIGYFEFSPGPNPLLSLKRADRLIGGAPRVNCEIIILSAEFICVALRVMHLYRST